MKLKPGAILAGLNISMRPALIIADRIWKRHGQELVITSGLDGSHSAGSYHYYGRAIDCRINYFTTQEIDVIMQELKSELPAEFDAVLESTHIHIEFDP